MFCIFILVAVIALLPEDKLTSGIEKQGRNFVLETDNETVLPGRVVFYISYAGDMFPTDIPEFLVTVVGSSGRGMTFTLDFENEGNYDIFVRPYIPFQNPASIKLTVNVILPSPDLCPNVGEFLINNRPAVSHWTNAVQSLNMGMWILVTRKSHNCTAWQSRKPKWTFEKINSTVQELTGHYVPCLNVYRIREINITDYTSKIQRVPLPGPSRESGFIIQPYSIPPGVYSICNTVSKDSVHVRHCGLFFILLGKKPCPWYTKVLPIRLSPEPEIFMWPLKDLTINVVDYRRIFSALDDFSSEIKYYKYKWECEGHLLCEHLKNEGTVNSTFRSLDDHGLKLYIPRDYMSAGTSVNITFVLTYSSDFFLPDKFCTDSAYRKIHFMTSVGAGVSIRCLLNCWKFLNTDEPLLLSLDCDECPITEASKPQISWSVSDSYSGKTQGQSGIYFLIEGFNKMEFNVFHVTVTVVYEGKDGAHEKITLGKMFIVPEKLPPRILHGSHLIAKSHESARLKPREPLSRLPRYDVSLDKLMKEFRKFVVYPAFITWRRLHSKVAESATKGNVLCDENCTDRSKVGNFPLCSDCTKYITCTYGIRHIRPCPAGIFYNAKLGVCDFEDNKCRTTDIERERPQLSYIDDYVLLRTMWAPFDVCVESSGRADSNMSYVYLELTYADGRRNLSFEKNALAIPDIIPVLGPRTNIEQLWKLVQSKDTFTVNDQTYLGPLTSAIEAVAKILKEGRDLAETEIPVEDNPEVTGTPPENLTLGTHDDMDKENITRLSNSLQDTRAEIRRSFVDNVTEVPTLVYDNITKIEAYETENITEGKAIKVLESAHKLHASIYEDPPSDDDLIRLKLHAIQAVTIYFLEFRKINPKSPLVADYSEAILENLFQVVSDIPKRMPLMYPSIKDVTVNYSVTVAFWMEPLNMFKDIIFDMGITKLVVDIEGLKKAKFRFAMNTYLNVAVYTSEKSALPPTTVNIPMNAPILHVDINMKRPTSRPFHVSSPGVYNIQFNYDFEHAKSQDFVMKLNIYSNKSNMDYVGESDCVFFRVKVSTNYAVFLNLKPVSDLKIKVQIKLASRLSDALKIIEEKATILPRIGGQGVPCQNSTRNPHSIFLPPLTMRQWDEMEGDINYYLHLSVLKDQSYKATRSRILSKNWVLIGKEVVAIRCMRVTCVQWFQSYLTNKDCKISYCSGGEPPHIQCICNQGNTFTAGVGKCETSFNIDRGDLTIQRLDAEEDLQPIIPAFVIAVWLVYFALLRIGLRHDSLERILGKTHAIEGVFSPFNSEHYLVCFVTGFVRGCGTTSTPYMTIIGTHSVSPKYKLESREHIFVSGSETWLLVSVPDELGKPEAVILFFEDENSTPWFIDTLYIRNIFSEEEWFCVFKSWIPNYSYLDFPFVIAKAVKKRVRSAKGNFGSILFRLMRNQHPIFALNNNIPGSNYTKAQHATFFFCGLLIVMGISMYEHELPTPRLVVDPVVEKELSLDINYYINAGFYALIAIFPIYFLGLILELSNPVDIRDVEYRQSVKLPEETGSRTADTENLASPNRDKTADEAYDGKAVAKRKYYFHPASKITMLEIIFGSMTSPPLSKYEAIILLLPSPVPFYLFLMSVLMVSVSYYVLAVGVHVSKENSFLYLYIVCVAYIVLAVVLYPVMLVVTAAVNTVLYAWGRSYYGLERDSVSRIRSIHASMLLILEFSKLNSTYKRLPRMGETKQKPLKERKIRWLTWYKRLALKSHRQYKNQVHYSNSKVILFIMIALLIINLQTGDIQSCYLQTKFVQHHLGVGRITDEDEHAKTIDDIWEHLLKVFHTIRSWRNEHNICIMNILSAVRLRQIRAVPYKGNCKEDFPDLINPRCLFNVEDSQIDTRNFTSSWDETLHEGPGKPGPYTYVESDDFSDIDTNEHHYPGGGYVSVFGFVNKNPEVLLYLRNVNWMDEHTKAVVVNINIINADSGLSTIIEHVYEFTLAGIFMYTSDLYTFPLKFSPTMEFVMLCLIAALALKTLYFTICEIRSCFGHGVVTYFSFGSSWLYLIERSLSVAVLLIYVRLELDKKEKLLMVQELHRSEQESSVFINFNSISRRKFTLLLASSSLVLTCFVKVILRFREYVLLSTFVNLIPVVAQLTFLPVLSLVIFACLGNLLFLTLLRNYYTFGSAFTTDSILLMETSALVPTAESIEFLGRLYIFVFFSIMFYLVLNYFIVLLNEAYSELKHKAGT